LFQRGGQRSNAITPKTVLGLSPAEDGFCGLETKNYRRMSPRPKLCFEGEITEAKTTKIYPGLSPDEDGFCSFNYSR
jgi:hypothetical protein